MGDVTIFKNDEFGKIRTVMIDGDPWFVGKDVARALGYKKTENAIANHVDAEDKTLTLIQGGCSSGQQKTTIINESGLYALIFGSNLPSAKRFKRWVTSEVLPAIRKTGRYSTEKDEDREERFLDDDEYRNPWGDPEDITIKCRMKELNRDIDTICDLLGMEKNRLLHFLYEFMEHEGAPLNSYKSVFEDETGETLSTMKTVCMSKKLFDQAIKATRRVIERERVFRTQTDR